MTAQISGLSPTEIARFDESGLVGPFKLVDPTDAEQLRRRIQAELWTERSDVYAHTEADIPVLASTRDRHLDSPLMYRLASHSAIVDRVVSLLGPDVLLWRSDFFRQGVGDRATVAHQDGCFSATRAEFPCIEAGHDEREISILERSSLTVRVPLCVSAWIAFTQTRVETGALWVVPGSHRQRLGEVRGEGFAGRPFVPARDFASEERLTIELEPGEFILFHNGLVHASTPTLEGERVAWTSRYVRARTLVYPRAPINAQGQDLMRFGSLVVAGSERDGRNPIRKAPPHGTGSLLEEAMVARHHDLALTFPRSFF